ncbi:MAG: hypothetical protein KKC76_03955 [Proteobacteria bacterium]|nr:hypothetical protein [Pseudomonadota bacterium]MBU4296369.1 hypothetical protein [Pseudomonadota bacterium]MCG2750053.1 hypothetical protein [Desulfobulbaceae bacterium]
MQADIAAAADGVELSAAGSKEGVAEFNDINNAAAYGMSGEVLRARRNSMLVMEGISIVTLLVGIALAFVLSMFITKPLRLAINNINEGAVQVEAASGQGSNAGQSPAEGGSEQAQGRAGKAIIGDSPTSGNAVARQKTGTVKRTRSSLILPHLFKEPFICYH